MTSNSYEYSCIFTTNTDTQSYTVFYWDGIHYSVCSKQLHINNRLFYFQCYPIENVKLSKLSTLLKDSWLDFYSSWWMADANASTHLDGLWHHHSQPLCITIHLNDLNIIFIHSVFDVAVSLFGAWIDHNGSIITRVFFVTAFIRIMMIMSASF